MNWTQIISGIGIVGVIGGLLTWLIKQLGQSYIDKNVKSYEQELNNKSELFKKDLNQSFEKFKSELAFFAAKANKLHDKRIDRIEEIYSLLVDFYNDMFNLISWKVDTGMTEEEKKKQEWDNVRKAGDAGNNFLNYYSKNKFYFNSDTCLLIDEIIKLTKDSHNDLYSKYIFGTISAEIDFEHFKSATKIIREKVPKVKEELEENFRKIIGVD